MAALKRLFDPCRTVNSEWFDLKLHRMGWTASVCASALALFFFLLIIGGEMLYRLAQRMF